MGWGWKLFESLISSFHFTEEVLVPLWGTKTFNLEKWRTVSNKTKWLDGCWPSKVQPVVSGTSTFDCNGTWETSTLKRAQERGLHNKGRINLYLCNSSESTKYLFSFLSSLRCNKFICNQWLYNFNIFIFVLGHPPRRVVEESTEITTR